MAKKPNLKTNPETGEILRVEDDKLVATIEGDKIEYAAPAYAKGGYKEAIEEAAASFGEVPAEPKEEAEPEPKKAGKDPRIPTERPERDLQLGGFSNAHINWDHANLSDDDFSEKYAPAYECWLELTAAQPESFANLESLENRFAALSSR